MKKITFIISLLLAFSTIGYSQVSGYTFSQSNVTYTPITGGTVLGNTTTDDQRFVDPATPLGGTVNTGVGFPIGFDFTYNGLVYDRFAVNANGWISLGVSTLTPSVNINTTSAYTPLSSTVTTVTNELVARIAGYARDLNAQTGAELRFETIGSAPNRKLVVQWSNYRNYNATGNNLNFQIVLNETTNSVDVIYGTMTVATSTTTMVGLRAEPNNNATNFNSRTSTTSWSSSAASTNAGNTMTISATIFPASGLQYSWSPPSCPAPTNVVVSNITTNSADFSWTAGGSEFDWEYLILPAGSPAPTGSGNDIDTDSFTEPGLTPGTAYAFWIRAYCSFSDQSNWVGPFNFNTLCVPYTVPYFEGFESGYTHNTAVGLCLSQASVTGAAVWTANNTLTDYNRAPRTGSWNAFLQWSNEDWLFIPIQLVGGTSYTVEAYARQDGATAANSNIAISYGTANNAAAMTNVITPATGIINGAYQLITGAFTPATDGVYYIGIKGFMNGSPWYISLDDISVFESPTLPPSCATNVVATPNASCGNFATAIAWDSVMGALGYNITIGTTSGGNDILDNVNLGGVSSYNFVGNINTTYYYTISPYNGNGPATGCVEQSFTTNTNGCYCTSNPTSNDGNGISNVQIGTTNFPTGDVTYFDHTATVVDLAQGINSNVQVTFATGYAYATNIWIDFNDNFTFEPSELVYSGTSTNANPTTLNASFIMPAGAALGQHRMRIGTADPGFGQVPPNPCYSGSWGVTLDFTINVVAASCTPPTVASSAVVADCGNSQYSVDVDVTTLGNGTPIITDGTNNWPVSTTGVITVGPFADATSVTLTILHGSDATCDLPLGNFNNICPPTNDTCATAIPVDCTDVVVGSTSNGATDTGNNASADVWYSYSGAAGDITASLCTNTTFDTFIRVFDACGGTQIASNDDSCGLQSSVTFTADGTSTYYIMVEGFDTATGNFELTVSCVLNANTFDNNNFMVYPNPVKDVLNLSYTSEISSVRVMNMLGQEVISRKLNAANAQVDMSQLSAGTYIVNVTIGDAVKTIKVVKQ